MTKDELTAALKESNTRADSLDAELSDCKKELTDTAAKLAKVEDHLEQTVARFEHQQAITKQALRLNIVLSGGLLRDP